MKKEAITLLPCSLCAVGVIIGSSINDFEKMNIINPKKRIQLKKKDTSLKTDFHKTEISTDQKNIGLRKK